MAIIRTSALVGAMSGSIGGVTFANAKRGLVARQRQTRTPPSTERSLRQQAIFENALRFWRSIDADARTSWRSAAVDFPQTNRLGITSPRSGFSLFLTVQMNRARVGEPMSPDLPQNILGTSEQSHLLIVRENEYSVTVTNDGPPQTDTFVIVQGVRHFSTIVPAFSSGLREILIDTAPDIGTKVIDFTDEWRAISGTLVLGEAFAIRLIFYRPSDNMFHQTPIDATGLVAPAG